MDLSDRDKDRLRKLAELYEREDLSDADYRAQYNEIVNDTRGTSELAKLGKVGGHNQASKDLSGQHTEPKQQEEPKREEEQEQQAATETSAKDVTAEPEPEQSKSEVHSAPTQSSIEEVLERNRKESDVAFVSSLETPLAKAEISGDSEERKAAIIEDGRKPTTSLHGAPRPQGPNNRRERQDSIIRPPSQAVTNTKNRQVQYASVQNARMRRRPFSLSKLLIVPAVFGLGICVALAVGYASSANISLPQFGGKSDPQPVENPTQEPAEQPKPFLEPLFGPLAVEQCSERCSAWQGQERQACARGCKRLSLISYGRRITLEKLDPKGDAERIALSCLSKPLSIPRYETNQGWRPHFTTAMNIVLQELSSGTGQERYTAARAYHESIMQMHGKLRMPPEGSEQLDRISEQLIRTSCLKTQAALTEVALGTVAQRSDEFSWEFYHKLLQALTPYVIEAQTRLSAEASKAEVR